jgi:hypothetical protein
MPPFQVHSAAVSRAILAARAYVAEHESPWERRREARTTSTVSDASTRRLPRGRASAGRSSSGRAPMGSATGSSPGYGRPPTLATPPNYVVIAGKAWDPKEDCGPEVGPEGINIVCTGKTGEATGVLIALYVVTFGTKLLIDHLTKKPAEIGWRKFPQVSKEDEIGLATASAAEAGKVRFTLTTSREMWMKSLEFYIREGDSKGVVSTQGTRRTQSITVPQVFLDLPNARLVFGKAKFLGVLTQMYSLPLKSAPRDLDFTFTWRKD